MSKVNFKIEKAVNGHILRSDICGVRVYEKKEDLCAFIASSLVNGIKFKDDWILLHTIWGFQNGDYVFI